MSSHRQPTRGPLVVIGDALLDVDLIGTVDRLAPDAPVPVLDVVEERRRPGGAGLAAVLAAADGRDVILLAPAVPAEDPHAASLAHLLDGQVELVCLPAARPVPMKTRLVASGHPLARVDRSSALAASSVPEQCFAEQWPAGLVDHVHRLLQQASAVLVADYGRGSTRLPVIRDQLAEVIATVPVVWDPHLRGAAPLPGTRLVTPNTTEAAEWAARTDLPDMPAGGPPRSLSQVADIAQHLVTAWDVAGVAVTLGERGALLSYGEGAPALMPVPVGQQGEEPWDETAAAGSAGSAGGVLGDTCGAGDRFAATAAGLLADGKVLQEAVAGAVAAASRFVAAGAASAWQPGAASTWQAGSPIPDSTPTLNPTPTSTLNPTPSPGHGRGSVTGLGQHHEQASALRARIQAAGGTVVATGGCFDLLHAGHVATLRAARALGDALIVCVNSDASVRRLKGPTRPVVSLADRVRVLEALECVDAVVVFDEDTPERVLDQLRPDVWVKGGDYVGVDLPEARQVRRWGGQAVVLPYLPGRSTSRLVDRVLAGQAGSTAGSTSD